MSSDLLVNINSVEQHVDEIDGKIDSLKNVLTGKFFMPKATCQLELPVVLLNLHSQVNRVNEETEIFLLLNIKMAIYPTGIFHVVLMNKLIYVIEPIINILKFKIKIS